MRTNSWCSAGILVAWMSNAFFGGFAIKLGLAGVGKAEVQGNGENQEFPGELPLWRPGEVFLVRGHR